MVLEFAREVAASIVAQAARREGIAQTEGVLVDGIDGATAALGGLGEPAQLPPDFPAWNSRTLRNLPANTPKILKAGAGTLGGILVVRNANDAQVLAYDLPAETDQREDTKIIAPAGVTGLAKSMDGFVNMPIRFQYGLVVICDVADALVTVYFV